MCVDYYEGEVCGIQLVENSPYSQREIDDLMSKFHMKSKIIVDYYNQHRLFVVHRFDRTKWNRLSKVQTMNPVNWIASAKCRILDKPLPELDDNEIAILAKIIVALKQVHLSDVSWFEISGVSY